MRSFGLWICLALSVFGCEHAPHADREPQGLNVPTYSAWLSAADQKISAGWKDSAGCTSELGELNGTLAQARRDFFAAPAATVLKDHFVRGATLRRNLKHLIPAEADAGCLQQARRFLYLQRMSEEVLLGPDPADALTGFPKAADLRNGDIILMRGKTFFSATIAQMPDGGSPYSHSALISKDRAGRVRVLESLAESGVIITPFEEYLTAHKKNPHSRLTVLRAKDPELAARAADQMHARIAEDRKQGRRVLYDYAMNVDEPREMFCTELVKSAFAAVDADRRWELPRGRSPLKRLATRTTLLKQLGIPLQEGFLPLDLELDPRFETVLEYRHGGAALAARRMDATLSSMYDWMERGYAVQTDYFRRGLVHLGFGLRNIGILRETIPANVPADLGDLIAAFYSVSDAVSRPLQNSSATTLAEMKSELADFRRADCLEHRASLNENGQGERDIRFHLEFRGTGKSCD